MKTHFLKTLAVVLFASGLTARADYLITVDETDPFAVVFTGTGNNATNTDIGKSYNTGMDLVNFFTADIGGGAGNMNYDPVPSLTGSVNPTVAYVVWESDRYIAGSYVDMNMLYPSSGAPQVFLSGQPAFTGTNYVDLSAYSLPAYGAHGPIYAGNSFDHGTGVPIGEWVVTGPVPPPVLGVTVSPSVTSNTYTGVITLDITGLTNTEQVTVQRWIDGNANGVIDAGEPMMETFSIADGGATVINGITNLNAPFDGNPTNGEITTAVNFAASMAIENMTGHFVYVVSSPTGRFAPMMATFTVTNAALNQSISGTIYSNGVPSPYAFVVAQDVQANNPVGSAVADASGHYSLALPPGGYALIASAPNCYLDQNTAPSFTLTNGISSTNDIFLIGGGPNTISGNIYDSANSNGIGGLLVELQSSSLFQVAFTDTNGNYSAAVTSAFWKIKPTKERLARRAYVLPEATFQVNATAGNVTNANIALPKGNALYYGRIMDNSNNPFANVEVSASTINAGAGFAAKGYSDQNGYYTVAVLGDLTNQWSCNVTSAKNTPIANYILNTFDGTTNAPNQVTLENFFALPATATISGNVHDNSGTNVTGVTLEANAQVGGNSYQTLDGTTDSSGNYSLAAAAGQWNVQFVTDSSNSHDLEQFGYVDITAPHVVSVPPTNAVLNITVFPVGTPFVTVPKHISSTQFGFTINGATNVNYTVQVSTNLVSTNWSTLLSFQMTTNPFPIVDVSATNKARFYRVQKN